MTDKFAIINRGIASSGKSTVSDILLGDLEAKGYRVSIHSTDNYFMLNGRYFFEPSKLKLNHSKNIRAFEQSLVKGVNFVICDNMNILPWHSVAYTDLARKYGYKIVFINYLPRALEEHLEEQTISETKPNAHGVPLSTLKKLLCDFKKYNDLLYKDRAINPKLHFDYKWRGSKLVKAGVAKHFDTDYLVNIEPENFFSKKENIVEEILNLIKN